MRPGSQMPRVKAGVRVQPRRTAMAVAVAVAAVGVGGAGWWARDVTFAQPQPGTEKKSVRVDSAEVVEASVGRTLTLGVTVRRPLVTVAANHLSGVVTAVAGGKTKNGAMLYEVGGVPVVAVKAQTPFYRDLAPGAEGDDVEALQQMLGDTGFFPYTPDGDFGKATASAVADWRFSLGLPKGTSVPLGQLVALRSVPGSVALDEGIYPGAVLAGGEEAVRAPSGEQTFVLVLSSSQESLVPAGATVRIPYGDTTWNAVVSGSSVDAETGNLELALTAPGGGSVCGDECDLLPADESLSLLSQVSTVDAVSGMAVPAAAVRTGPESETYVLLENGERVKVAVRGAGQGLVIVDGLEIGQKVLLSATDEVSPPEDDSGSASSERADPNGAPSGWR